jgi:hypothetical protein
VRALGTIIESYDGADPAHLIRCGMLDYYDHWSEIDPRLEVHHPHLSPPAAAFGHDLVHQATYVNEILVRLPSDGRPIETESVVTVGSMTEAFLVSVRSAYDAIAAAVGYLACEKPAQAPTDSLRTLMDWSIRNPTRVRNEVREMLASVPQAFWELRRLRDDIVHWAARATIQCDRRQFNLWVHGRQGWITREPLLPLLAHQHAALLQLADAAAATINRIIDLPADRIGGRVVEGVFIGSLTDSRRCRLAMRLPPLKGHALSGSHHRSDYRN